MDGARWPLAVPLSRLTAQARRGSVLDIILLFIVCLLTALFFIVRVVCAPFSSKASEQIRRHPIIHSVWGLFAFLSVLVLLGVFYQSLLSPTSAERHTQREKVIERVQSAGGWDAIRRGCVSLAEQNTNGFYSHWQDTDGLPTAIAALKPLLIEYQPQYGCVRIGIFGIHSTGGHSTPDFGLEVDTSTNSVGYNHGTGYDGGGVIGNHHSTCNQVAEGIYEVY
jgi:hypothetical protein